MAFKKGLNILGGLLALCRTHPGLACGFIVPSANPGRSHVQPPFRVGAKSMVLHAGSRATNRHEHRSSNHNRQSPKWSKSKGDKGEGGASKGDSQAYDDQPDLGIEEVRSSKPEHWPEKVIFSQKLRWSSQTSREVLRRSQLPGIRVDYITDSDHPLQGQYGVFATRAYAPFEVVGEYVGKVVPPGVYGDYVATIDYGDRRRESGVDDLFGVDGQQYGNEARMINHFKGIGTYPNVKLITAFLAELPHILVIVIRPIAVGEELLLDYGPHYWLSKYHAPPPDPLNPLSLLKSEGGLLKQTGPPKSDEGLLKQGLRKVPKKPSDKALAPESEEQGEERGTSAQRGGGTEERET